MANCRSPNESDVGSVAEQLKRPWYRTSLGPDLDRHFETATAQSRIWYTRLHLGILAALIVASLGLSELDGLLEKAILLHLGFVVPALIACILALSTKRAIWLQGLASTSPVVLAVGAICILANNAADPIRDHYVMSAGLLAASSNIILPLRVAHAAIMTVANLLVYIIVPFYVNTNIYGASELSIVILMVTLSIVTLHIEWQFERIKKNYFLSSLQSVITQGVQACLGHVIELGGGVWALCRGQEPDSLAAWVARISNG